jgi:hypothetical protein
MASVSEVGSLGEADIALREIIEDRIGFELPEFVGLTRASGMKGQRPQHWAKTG